MSFIKENWKPLLAITAVFLLFYYLPESLVNSRRTADALREALGLASWYAREHVILCLLPAFFIAGAISVFISQASVIRYLGAGANKLIAYSVAAVSGSVLAVCSCTVLPLFAGIYRRGAGIGPATAFLYSGPAINVMAVILTARILGIGLGVARAVGAVVFSIVIGLLMHLFFRGGEGNRTGAQVEDTLTGENRGLARNAVFFGLMVLVLVFANWSRPAGDGGLWQRIYFSKWILTSASALILALTLIKWFGVRWRHAALAVPPPLFLALLLPGKPSLSFMAGLMALAVVLNINGGETREWFRSSWAFALQILPLLFWGVLIAGALLGRPGHQALIPDGWVSAAVGGNSINANLFAAVAGAFMYFATLTEVPILQGLIGAGMGKGPALALLLAGPALSLPNMLVIRSILGTGKTVVFTALVIIMAAVTGILYGLIF
ncbi:MAG: permease [Candidatus Krumholzibacteriota bacterium]|nr:permease [Candidatus Krumholzibacteriota bacterium]